MKKWRLLSIKTQILVYYLATAVLIVVLLGMVLFYSTSDIIRGEVANTAAMAIENGGHQLEMYINQLKGLSGILAENKQVCRYFGRPLTEGGGKDTDRSDIEVFISSILGTNPEIASIMLIGSQGRIISNETDLGMEFSGNIREKDWYKAVLGSTMPVLTSARMQEFSMDKDTWVISLGRELKDDEGMHIGIMRIDLKYDVIESILYGLNLGRSGYSFILNNNGRVVYHNDPGFFSNEEKRRRLVEILEMKDKELRSKSILTHHYNLLNAGWTLVGVASLDSLMRMQRDIVIVLWIIGSVMVITAFGSSSIFANSISLPLRRLEKTMEKVEEGKLDVRVSANGSIEIESLSMHFKLMMKRIRGLMEEIKEKEQALHESNIKHLYSQINPHFLYNTMDTIIWLAELGNTGKVVSVSKAMARFFRLSLHGGNDITTVRDELDHVRQYLIIQKERYEEKLTYEITVDKELFDINIPKLLLQPIVENAINHGIRIKEGTGMVKVSGSLSRERLSLTVEDNGVGFNAAKPLKRPCEKCSGGVGLHNVEERIHLYYGKKYGLSIESTEGIGTKITISLGTTLLS